MVAVTECHVLFLLARSLQDHVLLCRCFVPLVGMRRGSALCLISRGNDIHLTAVELSSQSCPRHLYSRHQGVRTLRAQSRRMRPVLLNVDPYLSRILSVYPFPDLWITYELSQFACEDSVRSGTNPRTLQLPCETR